jgi:predicted ester cyclase
MPRAQIKALVEAYYQDVWNGQKHDLLDEYLAPGFCLHAAGAELRGRERFKEWLRSLHRAAPDYHIDLFDLTIDGDRCAFRWSSTGTHHGTLFGVPPTQRPFAVPGITILRVSKDRIIEGWTERDLSSLAKRP